MLGGRRGRVIRGIRLMLRGNSIVFCDVDYEVS